jgi:hypothetical protein
MQNKAISIIATVIFLWSFQLQAQSKKSNSILSQLSNTENVINMSFSKPMEDFFDMDIELNGMEKHLSGDFETGKLLIVNEERNTQKIIQEFKREGFKIYKLEEIEESDQVQLVYLNKGKSVSEAHFLIGGEDEFIVFSLYGDMKIDDK